VLQACCDILSLPVKPREQRTIVVKYSFVSEIELKGTFIRSSLITGTIILSRVAIELIFFGIKHHVWAILGSTMATAGITSLTLAILSLYLKRMEYRIMQKITQKPML